MRQEGVGVGGRGCRHGPARLEIRGIAVGA